MIQLGPDPHKWPEPFKSRYAERLKSSRRASFTYSKYQQDPHGYARDILKVTLTDEQSECLSSILVNRYTLAKASHDVGKTFLASVATNWWFDCWDRHIVYITAPTWDQALGLTFKAVRTHRRELQLPGRILDTGWVKDLNPLLEGAHYIRAFNAERGEGFQGEHEAPILIIFEEGPGVPKYIWEAAKGLMGSADCRMFVIGNPTDENTDFGLASENPAYNVITIKALDHPNITAQLQSQLQPYPKAVSLTWLYEMLRDECEVIDSLIEDAFEWHSLPDIERALNGQPLTGEKWLYMPNAVFQGRVLGEFPTQADQNVIPKGWLTNLPRIELKDEWEPELGCDPARFGDDRSSIFTRRGPCLLKGREIRKIDADEVASKCRDDANEAAQNWKPGLSREQHISLAKRFKIKIDVTGGLGVAPVVLLRSWGYNPVEVNSSAAAKDSEQYKNVRSELWFEQRERARSKRLDLSRLPKEIRTKLERELSTPRYKAPGQKVVEEKAKTKERLGASPDLADGANLAFYEPKQTEFQVIGRILG